MQSSLKLFITLLIISLQDKTSGDQGQVATLGYSLLANPPSANFVNVGSLMPGRGTGHVVETTNLVDIYKKANVLLRHSQDLFNNYIKHWNASFLPMQKPPGNYPEIKPPSPSEVLALAPPPGFNPATTIDGTAAVNAWYYVDEGLKGQLKAAADSFESDPQGSLTLAQFISERTPALQNSIHEYLVKHQGPYPHRDYAYEDVYLPDGKALWFENRNIRGHFYPYYLGAGSGHASSSGSTQRPAIHTRPHYSKCGRLLHGRRSG